MAFIDQDNLSNLSTFRQRIRMCICKAAAAVQAEPANTSNHVNRSILAHSILNSPDSYVTAFSSAVAADPNTAGINVNSTDDDLLFTVNSLYNAIAGVI